MENTIHTFDEFNFCPEILQGINEAGFKEPTPIQLQAIQPILDGRDLIGQALTGTGKTAAYGLPIMNKIAGQNGLQFLVLVPTRELAAQVSAELFKLGRYAGIHTAAFTGGQSYSRQEKLLQMGIDALVATPGRLLDLIDSGHFNDIAPKYFVVDEADEMLDMGFIDDVKKIFAAFNGPRQTLLFSATMPRPVIELAQTILTDPLQITTTPEETTNNDIEQLFFVIEDHERTDAIIRLIDAQNIGKAMIFCRTKEETDSLNILLGGRGYNVNCLHGDMEQAQRTRVMNAFRKGEFDIMVATDVAARGLDVDDVTHVFNFHLPFDSRGYVHRIGRTGRAGKTGTAITLVTPRELRQLEAIRHHVGAQIENRLIPTRSEVTSMKLKNLFLKINDFPMDMDILRQIQTLTVNQDLLVLLSKLAQHTLAGGADQGPEHIGIEGDRLQDILEHKRRKRTPGKDGKPFPRERRPRGERKPAEEAPADASQEITPKPPKAYGEEKPKERKPFRESRNSDRFAEEKERKPFKKKSDFHDKDDARPRKPFKDKPRRDAKDATTGKSGDKTPRSPKAPKIEPPAPKANSRKARESMEHQKRASQKDKPWYAQ